MNIVIESEARQWLLARGGQLTVTPPPASG